MKKDEYIAQANSKLNEKVALLSRSLWDVIVVAATRVPIWSSRLHGRISKTSSCRCDMYSFLGKRWLQPCPHGCNITTSGCSIDWSKSPLCGYWYGIIKQPMIQGCGHSNMMVKVTYADADKGKFVRKMDLLMFTISKNSVVQTQNLPPTTNVLWLKWWNRWKRVTLSWQSIDGKREMAPGQNPIVAYMTGGITSRMLLSWANAWVKEDVYTSVHLEIRIRNTRYQVRPWRNYQWNSERRWKCSSWLWMETGIIHVLRLKKAISVGR